MSKFEKKQPDYQEKKIKKQVLKIKKVIELEGKIGSNAKIHLDKAEKELAELGLEIKRQDLLRRALELLKEDWGGLPEHLKEKLLEIENERIANKIAKEWTSGEESDLRELLRKYVVEAKRQGIDINTKEIEERVRKS